MAVPKFITNDMKGGYVGGPTTPARRCYVGGTLVYQGFGPASEQEFIQQEAAGGPAQLLKVYGKSIVWNQQIGSANLYATGENNGVTFTKADDHYTLSGTATADVNIPRVQHFQQTNGHKYFCISSVPAVSFTANNAGGFGGTITSAGIIVNCTQTSANQGFNARAPQGSSFNGEALYIHIIDLTLLYGAGNEPTSVAQFLADYPTYDLTYDPGSLQSNKTAELRAERIPVINVWDEEWEVGIYNNSTGQKQAASGYIRAKNAIAVIPEETYYIKAPADLLVKGFDAGGTYLGNILINNHNTTLTIPSSCTSIVFNTASSGISTYNNDICINLSDPAINGQYFPHWRGSLALNLSTLTGKLNGEGASVVVFPDGLRGVGTDRDAVYGSTGEVRRQKITGAGFTLHNTSSSGYKTYKAILNGPTETAFRASQVNTFGIVNYGSFDSSSVAEEIIQYSPGAGGNSYIAIAPNRSIDDFEMEYPLATPLTYTLDTPLPTDLTCVQGDILQRVSDNNCPFVGEMKFGL